MLSENDLVLGRGIERMMLRRNRSTLALIALFVPIWNLQPPNLRRIPDRDTREQTLAANRATHALAKFSILGDGI